MNIFTKTYKMKGWHGSLLKISMIAFGIVLALQWPEIFTPFKTEFTWIFLIGGIYLSFIYWPVVFKK